MSTYRTYTVVLIDKTELCIHADDVDLDTCGEDNCQCHYFNFLSGDPKEEMRPTVAAIPFSQVLYIKS